MTTFNDKERGHEFKFAHEEKLSFDLEARTSKLFGLWAADKLGLDGNDASTYALEVVESNLEEPGFDDVLRKVRADFETKQLEISDHEMNVELDKALAEAQKQLNQDD